MDDLEQKKARRFLVLQKAYELSEGNRDQEFTQDDILAALSLSLQGSDSILTTSKMRDC
jgi:hypothetical protein